MRARLWRLLEGPEWADSLAAADPGDGYFEDNVDALRGILELDPFAYSHPFVEDRDLTRIATTKDVAAGYRLVILFRINPPKVTCELGWLWREPLDPEEA